MKVWITRLVKSKTMIFSMILAIIGVLQASTEVLSTLLTPSQFGLLTLGSGIIAAILRVVTKEPLNQK